MRLIKSLIVISCVGVLFVGCENNEYKEKKEVKTVETQTTEIKSTPSQNAHTGATTVETALKAHSIVHPTEGNTMSGKVTFTETGDLVLIDADFEGLKPGLHGFHVHEKGDCSAHDGSSAGGHFNPTHKKHGGPDSAERHVGDFGNLVADQDGKAHYQRMDSLIKLTGQDSIVGKSIVVHADPDDLESQPAGNSGARIGCGLIEKMN